MSKAAFTLIACALAAGCAGPKPAQPDAGGPAAASSSVIAAAPATIIDRTPEAPPAVTASEPAPAPKAPVAKAEPKAEPQSPAIKQTEVRAKAEPRAKVGTAGSTPAKPEAKATVAAPVVAEPAKAAAPVVAERKAEPSLNVSDLTTGLRETHAIGAFTKLALKNQLDDLLQKFRTTHQSGQQPRAAGLRQPYDALVGKVLGLLQPGDPALARKIESSREGIWAILSDPERFKSVT